MLLIVIFFGLIVGSFISAWSYRLPRGESVSKGRSKCPKCGKKISWYDNIPLLSYFILGGKCRNCGKKISVRYPLIELGTTVLYLLLYTNVVSVWEPGILLQFVFILIIVTTLFAIMIIDLENQLILDKFVFFLFLIAFINLMLHDNEYIFSYLFSGFAASTFLLLLHILTKGKGMGLGDVKLALFGGMFLGLSQMVSWLFLSFVIGALIGLILLVFGKAKFGKPIPFGPFMVLSFYIMIFWGDKISGVLFPYIS